MNLHLVVNWNGVNLTGHCEKQIATVSNLDFTSRPGATWSLFSLILNKKSRECEI